ncbi:hypothetical protein I302_108614 [Kwoniella bestiolae CBS 10118]|uniref:Uncharacterized protein n=1 Tax=Kwoniella bestiolae CBS 10118 TaxID=1296100 RepID=A0A1B9FTM2_9TREE|nr:hypothetical protein I302_07752 [Kwoniella bestiolae CBS 10118]OCF22110.1 hypothetical protein I302_07752 [Kwoniella bestiolae CBS 10118]
MRHALGHGQEQAPINPSTYAQPFPYEQPQAAPYCYGNGYQPTLTSPPESSPNLLPSSSYLHPSMSMAAQQAYGQPQPTPYNPIPSAPMFAPAQNYQNPSSSFTAPTPQPNAPDTTHGPDHPAPPPPFAFWCCQNCKTGRVPPYDEGQRGPYLC